MSRPTYSSFSDAQVAAVFDAYPDNAREKLLLLRQLVLDTSKELGITDLHETLKWGEPSYLTKHGSTIRLAWRKSLPSQCGLFFNCKTSLIETFREIYPDTFDYEGNRAIIFENRDSNDDLPINALKHCISLSLRYHQIKHLTMLGI